MDLSDDIFLFISAVKFFSFCKIAGKMTVCTSSVKKRKEKKRKEKKIVR